MKPWHDKARGVWWVDLRGSGGGRKSFESRDAAKDHIAEQRGELKQWGANGSMDPSTKLDCLAALDKAAKCGCPSLLAAVEYWGEHHHQLKPKPLQEAVGAYLEALESEGKRGTYMKTLRWVLGDLAKHFGSIDCHQLTLAQVKAWPGKRWKLATRKRYFDYVRVFINFCINEHWAKANPMNNMGEIILDDVPPGVLTVDDCGVLLKRGLAMDPGLLPYLALMLFGGLRKSEADAVAIGGLKKFIKNGHIDLWGVYVKGRKRRFAELEPVDLHGDKFSPLKEWLAYDTGPIAANDLRIRWHVLRYEGAKRTGNHRAVGGKLVVSAWPHDCARHTASSMLYVTIGPARESLYCGHSEAVAEKNYRNRFEPSEVKEFWGLTPSAILPS